MTKSEKNSSGAARPYLFQKGQSGNPKGKPKGVQSKTTTLLKDAILLAARRAGGDTEDGLATYLEQQATKNPGPFMSLLGKVLPMQLSGEGDGPLKIIIERYAE
jgi:hypothetical protein